MRPHESFLHPCPDQSPPEPLSGGRSTNSKTQQPREIPLASTNFAQQHASEKFALSLSPPQTPFHDELMITLGASSTSLLMGRCIRTTPALIPKPFGLSAFAQLMMMKGASLSPRWRRKYDLGLCFWTPKEEGAKQRWLLRYQSQ